MTAFLRIRGNPRNPAPPPSFPPPPDGFSAHVHEWIVFRPEMEAGKEEEGVGPTTVRQRFLSHLRPRVHVSIPITTRGTARGAAIKQHDRPFRGQRFSESLRATRELRPTIDSAGRPI